MTKLRLSYSILNLWARGLKDEAVNTIFNLEKKPTEAMTQGQAVDKLINDMVVNKNKLPPFFNNLKLKNPKSQYKIKLDYKNFTLVGVLDCYDEGTIYEFKTGKIPSNVYAQGYQVAYYGFLTSKILPVSRIIVLRYNQFFNQSDATLVFYTPSLENKAINFIEKNTNEIYQYLKDNDLLEPALIISENKLNTS